MKEYLVVVSCTCSSNNILSKETDGSELELLSQTNRKQELCSQSLLGQVGEPYTYSHKDN